MPPRAAAAYRWLCQMYHCRGVLPPDQWDKFADFCEAYGYTDEPSPGKRVDGQDSWDVFEDVLLTEIRHEQGMREGGSQPQE